jgi:hypothetical protein
MNESSGKDQRRLEIPADLLADQAAVELISAWFHGNQIQIITRFGTSLDQDPGAWGEVLAGIAQNVAVATQKGLGTPVPETLAKIKETWDRKWRQEAV